MAAETALLLFSSITYGFAMLALHSNNKSGVMKWLFVTFLLGAGFIAMEIYEFHKLIEEGFGPQRSGFLTGFFTLVGTHGLHVTSGLILDGGADRPGQIQRPDRNQQHAHELPEPVLALPGRGLDLRVHRRLPDGSSVNGKPSYHFGR